VNDIEHGNGRARNGSRNDVDITFACAIAFKRISRRGGQKLHALTIDDAGCLLQVRMAAAFPELLGRSHKAASSLPRETGRDGFAMLAPW